MRGLQLFHYQIYVYNEPMLLASYSNIAITTTTHNTTTTNNNTNYSYYKYHYYE